jgi:hypothetical protein
MSFKCKIGLHKWNGCKCAECGKIISNLYAYHAWESDCEKCSTCGLIRTGSHNWSGCKCTLCGKTRDEQHQWNHCRCSTCGIIRDEQHDWSKDCEICSVCKKTLVNGHKWNGCICTQCGKTRDEHHDLKRCKCTRCGAIRHDWSANCQICYVCGYDREVALHTWTKDSSKCAICNKEISENYLPLVFLSDKGFVSASGNGQSITKINARIENLVAFPIKVLIERGTYFKALGNHQNMVAREEYRLTLGPHQIKNIEISASCINAERPIPKKDNEFNGVSSVNNYNLTRFLEASKGRDPMVVQAGIWAITDGYTREKLKKRLINIPDRFSSSKFNIAPAISDGQIDEAKRILDMLNILHSIY